MEIKLLFKNILSTDFSEYEALLDRAFGLTGSTHFLEDFPIWNPSIPNQSQRFQIGGWTDGQLITSGSLRIANYRSNTGESFKLGMIGAMATAQDRQGKGLGSEVLERLIEEGKSRGVQAFVLWGAGSPLYKKQDFVFAGRQLRTRFNALDISGRLVEGFEVRTGWEEAIAVHLLRRKTGVQYSDADILWLSRHTGVQWRTLWLEGECIAYCGWNRGIDLPKIIHELGGSEIGMRTLLDFVRKKYPSLELLHHPDTDSIGIISSLPEEFLAQFLFVDEATQSQEFIDSIWLSGMDSC